MKKEIGSEFWDIPLQEQDNRLFDERYRWFISGRAALDHILKDIKTKHDAKTALLPSWCCESMIEPFIRNDIQVSFYSVTIENGILTKRITDTADILLNMRYFGYADDTCFSFSGIVIDDISHSIFSSQKCGDYCFGSLRKWAGFKTGGFAIAKDGFAVSMPDRFNDAYISLRSKAMAQKKDYIESESNDKGYLKAFAQAEEMLDVSYGFAAYPEDIIAAKHLNVTDMIRQRKNNAGALLKYLKEYAMFKKIQEHDCPLCVPIMVPDCKRDDLRQFLIGESIYCPTHWPIGCGHQLNAEEKQIYDNELSIICDQRYTVDDMEYVGRKVREFLC